MPTHLLPSVETAGLPRKCEAANTSVPLKKKKKRRREEEGTEETTGEVVEKRKKKKKKRRHTEEGAAKTQLEIDEASIGEVQPVEQQGQREKETSSEAVEPQIDPVLETPEARDAAAALLSAIVAATSGFRDSGASDRVQQSQPHYVHAQNPLQASVQFPLMLSGYGQLPFIHPHPTPPSLAADSSLFPTGGSLSLSELNFGSNDDVLRALQALDMSKITSVLRNISEGPAGADDSTMTHSPNLQGPPPLVNDPPMSMPILPMGQVQVSIPDHRRMLGLPTYSVEQQGDSPNHSYLLANKWLSASKLADLVRTEGLVYKKGKFSAFEEEQLEDAIERFRTSRGLTEDQIQELIFPQSEKNRDNIFWSELTSAVPLRPIIAVYHHIRRTHHPYKKRGAWTADQDAALEKAVIDHGQQWEKIGPLVMRMPSDCRDRYRNHIVNKNIRVTGPWSKEEEDQLTRIVTDMTVNQGRDIDGDVFWGRVSELMGGKRGRQQCRIKWTDALCKNVKTGGRKARWSPQDAYILVHKLTTLNVRDDTEIDWKLLPDPVWNLWSPHTLQRRWLTMKRGIKGWEDMTHQEIMDILRVRKAHLPPSPPPRKKRERRIISAIAVVEEGLAQLPPNGISGSVVAGAPGSEPAIASSSAGSGKLSAENDHDSKSSSSDSE
ncbi:DNA-binding protein REB1 [Termitomyces sp. T112]|nr:DNA-binding protein REB1 [Termitomyces sp. T112]